MLGAGNRVRYRNRRALFAGSCLILGAGLTAFLWQTTQFDPGWFRVASAAAGLLLVYGLSIAFSPRRADPREDTPAGGSGPGYRDLEQARALAEHRCAELQETVTGLRAQFKQMLEELKIAEARLAMREHEAETSGADLTTLRKQLRETSGRLRKAELDNHALRERLAIRSKELDELKGQLTRTTEKLHLSKLSEALRELERVS
jgi:septal ring factor EnvC (AmiA/AmiB activator)